MIINDLGELIDHCETMLGEDVPDDVLRRVAYQITREAHRSEIKYGGDWSPVVLLPEAEWARMLDTAMRTKGRKERPREETPRNRPGANGRAQSAPVNGKRSAGGRHRATGKVRRHVFISTEADDVLRQFATGDQSAWISGAVLDRHRREAFARAYLGPVARPVLAAALSRMSGLGPTVLVDSRAIQARLEASPAPPGVAPSAWAEFCGVVGQDYNAAHAVLILARARCP